MKIFAIKLSKDALSLANDASGAVGFNAPLLLLSKDALSLANDAPSLDTRRTIPSLASGKFHVAFNRLDRASVFRFNQPDFQNIMNTKLRFLLAIFPAIGIAALLTGCHTPTAKLSPATPCMAQLDRFTAPDVPAMGPAETESPMGKWTNAVAPAGLPGKGLAQHPMLYVGENYTKMFLVNDGKVLWTYQTGKGYEYDDVWMLSNGNILFTRMQYVAEITPDKKVVWRYDCDNSTGTNHTEVHTCQPIGLDKVMFVLNGLPPRLMVVNIKTGAVEVNHELPYGQPLNTKNIHGQFRRARYTAQGTYLVSYLSESNVVEYDKNFNKIWSYPIRSPWAALRLKNGNTLITDEARQSHPRSESQRRDGLGIQVTPTCRRPTALPRHRKAAPVWPTATRFSAPEAALAKARNSSKSPRTRRSSGFCKIGRRSVTPPPCKYWTIRAFRKFRANRSTDQARKSSNGSAALLCRQPLTLIS